MTELLKVQRLAGKSTGSFILEIIRRIKNGRIYKKNP